MAGHSIGEYVAGTIAGVFDIETAIKVVSMRARLMHAAPRGVMVAVALSPDALAEHLAAMSTSPRSTNRAAAWSPDPRRAFVSSATASPNRASWRAGSARRTRSTRGLMDSMIPEFTGFLSRQTLREPQIPLLSNVTGTWLAASEATNPATWARQVRSTVRFSDEVDVLLGDPNRVLVEVGPGRHADRIGDPAPQVVERPPRGSADAPPRPEPRRPRRIPAGARTTLVGRGRGRLGAAARRAAGRSCSRCPAIPLSANGIGSSTESDERMGGRCRGDQRGGRRRPAAAEAAQAAKNGQSPMEATLQRIWGQCLGLSLGRPQRQLL